MHSNNHNHSPFWLCPSCHNPLVLQDKVWRCDKQHSFDCAKEGYVNLLLAQQKSSKDPGDNKEMVAARRAFLAQDHYLPLASKIAELLFVALKSDKTAAEKQAVYSIYDAGCGEGYYLATIRSMLAEKGFTLNASGSDISKSAIQKAAKKYKDIQYAVASSFNLPLTDDSQDALIQVFAPSDSSQVSRVLKSGGLWLKVTPASQHLFELKQYVYEHAVSHDVDTSIPAHFNLVSQHRLAFTLRLDSDSERESLLMMTPFYWTISADKKRELLQDLKTVSADFDITLMINNKD
ncbi:MAG: methyltransferase domain-containing protein, partial [Paraglaciecola sp.]|nr:methyltransferase domain-containing protein [Paraglaciecola sp.]